MFGIKKKDREQDCYFGKSTEINFPMFPTYTHSKEIEDLYYKVKDIQRDFYNKDSNSISTITFPPSYYEEHSLISTMKYIIQDLLTKEFEKGEIIEYIVDGYAINTNESLVKELTNGCLQVTKHLENEIIIDNYTVWSAKYKAKRMIPLKTIKELKQLKQKLEKLK